VLNPKQIDLRFLIISNKFWGMGDTISLLKRKASRESKWEKGANRIYYLYLVHKDTKIVNDRIEYPSEQAAETALYLGTI
jgi:hypothetical protein